MQSKLNLDTTDAYSKNNSPFSYILLEIFDTVRKTCSTNDFNKSNFRRKTEKLWLGISLYSCNEQIIYRRTLEFMMK